MSKTLLLFLSSPTHCSFMSNKNALAIYQSFIYCINKRWAEKTGNIFSEITRTRKGVIQQLVGKRGVWEPEHGHYSPQYDDKEEKKDNWILAENGHSGIWTVDYKFQRITRYSGIFRSQILRRIGGYKDKNMNKLVIWGKKIIKRISIHIICFSSLNIINTVCSWQICPNNTIIIHKSCKLKIINFSFIHSFILRNLVDRQTDRQIV